MNSTGTATADFFVKARSFGVTSNGVNASAAVPEVLYRGLGQPMLLTLYHLRSANGYDWSASPVAASPAPPPSGSRTSPAATRRAAIGVDHAAQAGDDIKIFVAGALLGIAGGAIIAAVRRPCTSATGPGRPREPGQPRAARGWRPPHPGACGMSRCESNRPPVWIRCGPRLTESSWNVCISGRG